MITVHVDPTAALGYLNSAQERQLPYAVSLALNRVANLAQAAEREHMQRAFKLRREAFVLRGVKIAKQDRATKSSWRVVIQLAYPDGRHFLDQHETGGERQRYGGGRLWRPNKEVFKGKVIGRSNPLHPSRLHLTRDKSGRIQGQERAFLVRSKGKVLVLQRVDRRLSKRSSSLKSFDLDNVQVGMGPRHKKEKALHRTVGTRLLYTLVSRVRIPARLEFALTISRKVQDEWAGQMAQALNDATKGAI